MIVIYAGPTISFTEITQQLDCVCCPPIQHGDLLKILPDKPEAIGIIDGYFEGAPSVWHKEILYAMDQGVPVFGAASMGALRAAELHLFGMQGVGQIFEWYRDEIVTDDDEVAVLHGPQEVDFMVASDPMVNIRATLDRAHVEQIITNTQKSQLLTVAKDTFYKKRSWSRLLQTCLELFDKSVADNLQVWLETNRIDLKKQDALLLLDTLRQSQLEKSDQANKQFHFEWTQMWDNAFQENQRNTTHYRSENDRRVLNELSLNPDQFERYRDKALLCWIGDKHLEFPLDDARTKMVLTQFRATNCLATRPQLQDYMQQTELNEQQLTTLLEDASRVEQIRQTAGNLLSGILDQLKLDGHYLILLELVNEKIKLLQSAKLNPQKPGVVRAQLLAWYFEHQLGTSIPRRLEEHLDKTGFDSTEDFYRSIAEDYLYWRERR